MPEALDDDLRTWRHALHERAETAFGEVRTAEYLAEVLQGLGLQVVRGVGGTGLVASLSRGLSSRAVGIRADMDALPLTERGDRFGRSDDEGAMHACGHDGHMAMVLGAAAALAQETTWEGTIHLLLQPAEEPGRGALAMLEDGLIESFPMDAVFGLHNMPGIPAGDLRTRSGAFFASEDRFEIRITGRGGHAARPQAVIDPLVVAAEVVVALQTIVARSIDPVDPAVVSCTEFETDGIRNAIPSEVVIRGDARSFTEEVSARIESRMRTLVEGVCTAHRATGTVDYTREFRPTVNDPRCTALAVAAAASVVGESRVDGDCAQVLASEDFGELSRAIPGCFLLIGNGVAPDRGSAPLHSSDYELNDDILKTGVRFFVELVRRMLPASVSA